MRKGGGILKLLVLVIVLVIVGYFAFQAYIEYLKSPLDLNGEARAFVVKDGETVSQIADRLEREKFIRSALAFKLEYKNSETLDIQAGDYVISPSQSIKEIIEEMKEGSVDRRITLIEGWRVEEMADKLNEKLNIEKQKFIELGKKEEGYLFPDTYFFNPKVTEEDIIGILRNTFDQRFDLELKAKTRAKGLSDEEAVILASIVEREARSDEVRKRVAAILLKRLSIGMKLDADATVQYAMGYDAKNKTWWRKIIPEDYKFKSDYNTYLNNGLPPGPICNPSLSALKAVAEADLNTPYLYYFHDSKGNSYYGRTLEEHNENVTNHK